jgi:hypothetical protein
MNQRPNVFSQLTSFLPDHGFRRYFEPYQGCIRLRRFSCWDQYLAMAFTQLTFGGNVSPRTTSNHLVGRGAGVMRLVEYRYKHQSLVNWVAIAVWFWLARRMHCSDFVFFPLLAALGIFLNYGLRRNSSR